MMPSDTKSIQVFKKEELEFAMLESICDSWEGHFWSFKSVWEAVNLKTNETFYVSNDNEIEGIILADVGDYSAELLYVYVRHEFRGQKIASLLLDYLIAHLMKLNKFENLFLEVRPENLVAVKLYESHGFCKISERKKYYSDGGDALVYSYEFSPNSQKAT